MNRRDSTGNVGALNLPRARAFQLVDGLGASGMRPLSEANGRAGSDRGAARFGGLGRWWARWRVRRFRQRLRRFRRPSGALNSSAHSGLRSRVRTRGSSSNARASDRTRRPRRGNSAQTLGGAKQVN